MRLLRKSNTLRNCLLLIPLVLAAMNDTVFAQDQLKLSELSLSPMAPQGLHALFFPHPGKNGFYLETGPNTVIWESLDGVKTVLFNLSSIPRRSPQDTFQLTDYTSLPLGGFAALLEWRRGDDLTYWTIAEFGQDGAYDKSISLDDLKLTPFHFVVFDSGDIFIEGGAFTSNIEIDHLDEIVLDSMGTIKAHVRGPEITETKKGATDKQTRENVTNKSEEEKLYDMMHGDTILSPGEKNRVAAEKAILASGDDGYIYAYWQDIPDAIQRISQAGDVSTIPHAVCNSGDIRSFMVSQGKIATLCTVRQADKGIPGASKVLSLELEIRNLANPSSLTTYSMNTSVIPVLLGFDSNNFYFIRAIKDDPRGLFFIAHMGS